MKFKTHRIEGEFYKFLHGNNNKLYTVLLLLENFTQVEFKKEITLTDLFRTKEEFQELYAATPEDKRPKSSPHMFWKACDIRSNDFTDKEKQSMLKFLNCFTYASGQGKPVAFIHTIQGNVEHFHIQCDA